MKEFIKHTGITLPLDRANIDTDAIIPKQFLRKIERTGFGIHLFHEWRYLDYEGTQINPDFELNKPKYKNASILLTRDNFGCGSSREHAPWALKDYGFQVIIAPSFADIFYNNCVKNGILLIRLSCDEIEELFQEIKGKGANEITADLENQEITSGTGKKYSFEINPFAKECLLKGLDPIGWTLQFEEKIKQYENNLHQEKSWIV